MSEQASGQGKVIGLIITLSILGTIGTLIAYAFKSQIGLDGWNIDWLNGLEEWVQSFLPVTAVRGGDFDGVAFFDESGKKCVIGESTMLSVLGAPSDWKAIMLYNSEKATFYVEGDETRSFEITQHADEATIQLFVDALVVDGNFDEKEQSLAVKIEDAFDDAVGYVRVLTTTSLYATVGTSEFLDISRRTNLQHGACPPGLECTIYPTATFRDTSDFEGVNNSLSSASALGAYSYQWVKGSDSVPRPVVGIENYLKPQTDYALEYEDQNDASLDFAGHTISPGDQRGALSEPSSDNPEKYTDIIYNSFNMVSAATVFDDFYCRYGKKISDSGEGAFTDKDQWPECFPGESQTEQEHSLTQ
jgi:hypothetical protein